jgi:hypothetical protein
MIAAELGAALDTVGVWRRRFAEHQQQITQTSESDF